MSTLILDDLPADRLRKAMTLLRLVRGLGLQWVVADSSLAQAATDLFRCGIIRTRPSRMGSVDVLLIERPQHHA